MTGKDVRIAVAKGGEFDCYVAAPASAEASAGKPASRAPAVIIVPSVFGVDPDVRRNCDELAAAGFLAAAPDMFWRGDAGPMDRSEEGQRRARERALDRDRLIEQGVADVGDVAAYLRKRPDCNGKIAVVGLCYGGPYAILAQSRLGCDAGLSLHGTKVEAYLGEVRDVRGALVLHWGDQDHAAPLETLARVREATRGMKNVEIVIYPGVKHGYTSPAAPAWSAEAAAKSWRRTVEVLKDLRETAPVG